MYFSNLIYQGSLDKCISCYDTSVILPEPLWSMNVFYIQICEHLLVMQKLLDRPDSLWYEGNLVYASTGWLYK